jgi:hypothetical protein
MFAAAMRHSNTQALDRHHPSSFEARRQCCHGRSDGLIAPIHCYSTGEHPRRRDRSPALPALKGSDGAGRNARAWPFPGLKGSRQYASAAIAAIRYESDSQHQRHELSRLVPSTQAAHADFRTTTWPRSQIARPTRPLFFRAPGRATVPAPSADDVRLLGKDVYYCFDGCHYSNSILTYLYTAPC